MLPLSHWRHSLMVLTYCTFYYFIPKHTLPYLNCLVLVVSLLILVQFVWSEWRHSLMVLTYCNFGTCITFCTLMCFALPSILCNCVLLLVQFLVVKFLCLWRHCLGGEWATYLQFFTPKIFFFRQHCKLDIYIISLRKRVASVSALKTQIPPISGRRGQMVQPDHHFARV